MVCPGYHSPQFSEDIAWLPAWLQPYEHPENRLHGTQENMLYDKSQEFTSFVAKKCQSNNKNLYKGDYAQPTTSRGAKYTGCHLHLSGDDDEVGSVSCSNAMCFGLHLSAASNSELSYDQLNELSHLRDYEANKCLSEKGVSGNPEFTHDIACQDSFKDSAPKLNSSSGVFKQNVSYKPNSCQFIKTKQDSEEFRGKFDGEGIKSTFADDAVELSISASEAVVISEMMFSTMEFGSFSDAALFEIALRVKQARNEFVLETPSEFVADDLDDIDRLSDLNEDSMSGAFEDVGIAVPKLAETSKCAFASRKSSDSAQGLDVKQQEILKPNSHALNILADKRKDLKELLEEIKGDYTSKTNFQICNPLDYKLESNSMLVDSHSQMQTRTLDYLPSKYSMPSLKDHVPVQVQKFHINDALTVQENHCAPKVEKTLEQGNTNTKKRLKMSTWETSFLSESMNALDQSVSHIMPSIELAMVSSPGIEVQEFSSSYCKVDNFEAPLSQDYSSHLSLADSLCSAVPCSISSGKSKEIMDGVKNLENPMTMMLTKCFDQRSTLQNNIMSHNYFPVHKELILSETKFEQPSVNFHKLNSLRPYSLIPDSHKKVGGSHSTNNQLALHGVNNAVMHASNERIVELSNICDPEKFFAGGKSNNEHSLEHQKFEVPLSKFPGTEHDNRALVHENPCDRHETIRRLSTLDLWIDKSNEPTTKASCGSDAINKSHNSEQFILQSFSDDKKPRKRRVRFLEAAYNVGSSKASNLHSKSLAQSSCSRTAVHIENCSLIDKSVCRWDQNCNYLTSKGKVRNNGIIFRGLEFLLTGFSSCKAKNLEELIRKHGGYVLPNIPSHFPYVGGKSVRPACGKLPIVLSPKKVQTTKFLYGCAANTYMLNEYWLEDSIESGAAVSPWKYMNRPIPGSKGNKLSIGEFLWSNTSVLIFHKVGIMLHGKGKFCTKFMKIVKHGGGQVFKSLQRLVQSLKTGTNTLGFILVQNENGVSRHLKHCALEHNIPTVPASWLVNSLFCGKLVSLERERCAPLHKIKMPSFPKRQVDAVLSQEI